MFANSLKIKKFHQEQVRLMFWPATRELQLGVKCASNMQKMKSAPSATAVLAMMNCSFFPSFDNIKASNMIKAPPFDKADRAYTMTLHTEEAATVIFYQSTASLLL